MGTSVQPVSAMREWLDRYAGDPVLFVREVLNADPDEWQHAVLESIQDGDRRIAIRSGHGVGKTTLVSWIIIWHMATQFPQKTVATAASAPQLFDALVPEAKSWLARLPPMIREIFTVQAEGIFLTASPNESFVSFRTSKAETPEAMAGVHSDHVLLICDEASGIPEPVYEAAAGSMSGPTARTILTGNPVRRKGYFYEAFHSTRDMWTTYHVSCLNSPRVDPRFPEEIARLYGERSNAYRVRVEGNFPLADDDSVIPFDLCEAALERDVAAQVVMPLWGLDPARMGRDRSALAKRKGNVLMEPVKTWSGLDTMELCGRVLNEWQDTPLKQRPSDICVDAIGLGAGVADRLRELGLPIRAINVSESPALTDRYMNLRAELWFKARAWFETRACALGGWKNDEHWQDDELMAELVSVEYKITSSGKQQIIAKKDAAAVGGHKSPDKGDAFVLTMAAQAISAASDPGYNGRQLPKRIIKGLP